MSSALACGLALAAWFGGPAAVSAQEAHVDPCKAYHRRSRGETIEYNVSVKQPERHEKLQGILENREAGKEASQSLDVERGKTVYKVRITVPESFPTGNAFVVTKLDGEVLGDRCAVEILAADREGGSSPGGRNPFLASLQGIVTDQSGAGIPGATVTVHGDFGTRMAMTGSDGRYRVPGLPLGRHEVTVELSGFARTTREVEISVGASMTLNLTLSVGPIGNRELR